MNRMIGKWEIRLLLTILVVMIGATIFSADIRYGHSTTDLATLQTDVNTSITDYAGTYGGIFSTAVTASVNPTATLSVIAVVGVLEKADVYAPNVAWMGKVSGFLNRVPFLKTARDLPVANPVAMVILLVVTGGMYVLRSIKTCKAISGATIDKIERIAGYVITVGMSLLPIATSQAVAASGTHYVSKGTYVGVVIISALASVFNAFVYFCISKCVDAVENIATCVPVNGMNFLAELAKWWLHAILVVLQIFAPVLSVIFSILIVVLGVILCWQLMRISTYYKYIYLQPLWDKIFHRHKMIELVHEKFPKRGRKLYPETAVAIPTFSMRKYSKILKKREILWLMPSADGPKLVRIRFLRKTKEIPVSSLIREGETLYLQKTIRFNRLMTEDKSLELIFSGQYNEYQEKLLEYFGARDYQEVIDRKKAEKQNAKMARREERAARRQAKRDAWYEARMKRFDKS